MKAAEAAEALAGLASFGMTAEEAVRAFSSIRNEDPIPGPPPKPKSKGWRCAYCGAGNDAADKRCHNCGGPR